MIVSPEQIGVTLRQAQGKQNPAYRLPELDPQGSFSVGKKLAGASRTNLITNI